MIRKILVLLASFAALLCVPLPAQEGAKPPVVPQPAAQSGADAPQDVAIAELRPFTTREENGRWSGPAVDLFRAAAEEAGFRYRLVPTTIAQLGQSDAAVAFPIIAHAQMPDDAARSLPFYVDSVGLIGQAGQGGFLNGLMGLFNMDFLRVLGMVSILLLIAGAIFYFVERKTNDGLHADDGRIHGIGHGFWWAGVTATTIGYGDLVPKTRWGRIVAMIWMLFSMALTAILTAYIITLTGAKEGRSDLADAVSGQRIGYVGDGTIEAGDLRTAQRAIEFATMDAALAAFDNDEIDAVAAPFQQAKQIAGQRDLQQTAGSAIMPVFRVTGNPELRTAIDAIVLSPDWQARIEGELGPQ